MKPLSAYQVLTFDCYGTLIDWEAGIAAALQPLSIDRRGREEYSSEQLLARFAEIEADQEHLTPGLRYSELLTIVYARLASLLDRTAVSGDAAQFGASVPDWPAFPDSAEALAYLKKYYRLVILSNVDRKSFEGSRKKLGVEFDAVYTAEDIGAYKPSLRNFEYLIDRVEQEFGVPPAQVLHVAQSLYHDHAPANQIGLASAFIDRRQDRPGFGATKPPAPDIHYDFYFASMAALVDAHRLTANT